MMLTSAIFVAIVIGAMVISALSSMGSSSNREYPSGRESYSKNGPGGR